jgi:hypothetical protein
VLGGSRYSGLAPIVRGGEAVTLRAPVRVAAVEGALGQPWLLTTVARFG